MSRSRRKNPIASITTAESEHKWKRTAQRKCRHRAKQTLKVTKDGDKVKDLREISDIYWAPKDGKIRFDPVKDRRALAK